MSNLVFYLNGQRVVIENPDPSLLLIDYLRSPAVGLMGTKLSCGEGGCGACTTMIAHYDRQQNQVVRKAVNACLRPLCSLEGTAVTTIEGIGNSRTGLNPVQERLAAYNGTQCGYCSPGFVMNAYAYLRENEQPSEEAIENLFGGNLCRCTGYRPILDAMRSFAQPPYTAGVPAEAFPAELMDRQPLPLQFAGHGYTWYRPTSLAMAQKLKEEHYRAPNDPKLVGGNTSIGIYKKNEDNPHVLIDITAIDELQRTDLLPGGMGIEVGGGVTYSRLLEFLTAVVGSHRPDEVRGLAALQHVIQKIAGAQVCNVATIGGAVALTWIHAAGWGKPFPSDIYTVLAALGATITLASHTFKGGRHAYSALELPPAADWPHDAFVLAVHIPLTSPGEFVHAYRVARREQNAHALVNATFRVSLDASMRVTAASLVYGAVANLPVHATQTEAYLIGRDWRAQTLEGALALLHEEMATKILPVDDAIPWTYRLQLAETFFYRFFLWLAEQVDPGSVDPQFASGSMEMVRELSSGVADIQIENAHIKLSAPIQASGELVYTTDIPLPAGTLFGAFVYSPKGHATFSYPAGLSNLMPLLQGRFPGVRAYFTAHDMPGSYMGIGGDDPVLASDTVTCYGQAVGVVVAIAENVAIDAAAYLQQECIAWHELPMVIGIEAARAAGSEGVFANPPHGLNYQTEFIRAKSDDAWFLHPDVLPPGADGVVSGQQRSGMQAQFYMELQAVLAQPNGDGTITVHASTQSADSVQSAVASILTIQKNQVQVRTKPLGGGFGGKTTRSPYVAGPIALAAWKLNRPVCLAINRNIDMAMIGKRHAFEGEYQIAYKNDGTIVGMNTDLYSDGGNTIDCSFFVIHVAQLNADNCYNIPTFRVGGEVCKTNVASNNAMRAYGVIQTLLVQEDAIEQAAYALKMRPEAIRKKHLYQNGDKTHYGEELKDCIIRENWAKLEADCHFEERLEAVEAFNRDNRWKKRGISMMPLKYGAQYELPNLNYGSALVSTYSPDGSVLVQCGGVENGQGLQTKVAQVAARALGIPLDMVRVGEVDTAIIANATSTGGDSGSDLNGWAVYIAATQLRKRLEQYCAEAKGDPFPDWKEKWAELWPKIVASAVWNRVDVAAYAYYKTEGITPEHPFAYYSWSMGCSEVEVDVLTGQCTVLRSDILFDAGQPLNPLIDLGQVQGAFVQGIGYVLTEEILFDADGRLITDSTWEYKPPCTLTIPVDFRVSLRDSERPATRIPIAHTVLLMAQDGATAAKSNVAVLAHQAMQAAELGLPLPNELGRVQVLNRADLMADPVLRKEMEDATAAALHSAKCIGEPPLILAVSVFCALKQAVLAARIDAGTPGWFQLDAPATVARIQEACLVDRNQLQLEPS